MEDLLWPVFENMMINLLQKGDQASALRMLQNFGVKLGENSPESNLEEIENMVYRMVAPDSLTQISERQYKGYN